MADIEKNLPEEEKELEEIPVFTLTDEETGEEKDFELLARAELDGKLYFDMKFDKKSDYTTDWTDFEAEFTSSGEDTYSIEITARNEKGRKTVINAAAVTVDGSIRLDNIYS